jgi:hypothetical protein
MPRGSLFKNAQAPLDLTTYDGSGQCVHPDVIAINHVFYDFKYLMVMEPYPFGNDLFENPSLLCSDDGITWTVAPDIDSPLVPPPQDGRGWNSDADLLNQRNQQLALYYRYNSGAGETTLFRVITDNGSDWSEPQRILTCAISGHFASPALVARDGEFYMFYVDTLRTSINLLKSTEGQNWKEQDLVFTFPNVWHLDALISDGVFYLLINDKHRLFLVKSDDLGTWFTYDKGEPQGECGRWSSLSGAPLLSPLLSPSQTGWDDDFLYRSTFLIENGVLRLWYSAKSSANVWRIGYTDGRLCA